MHFLVRYKYTLLLILVFITAVFLVKPFGDFPLNDDWCYAKSVRVFLQTGEIDIGFWAAATLATQIIWGAIWTKLFGFSFVVLHASTLFSAFCGLLLFYFLVKELSKSHTHAFFATLSFYFVPVYFNLSFTFMTDVNFITLLLLFTRLSFQYFKSEKLIWLLPLLLTSLALVLLRQFGLFASAVFVLASLLRRPRSMQTVLSAVLVLGVTYCALHYYENYLKHYLPDYAFYKFSGKTSFFTSEVLMLYLERFKTRLPVTISVMLFYMMPLAIAALPVLFRSTSTSRKVGLLLVSAFITIVFLKDSTVLPGNIVNNMSVGPETFAHNFLGFPYHSYSGQFTRAVEALKIIYFVPGIWVLLCLFTNGRVDAMQKSERSLLTFSMLFIAVYAMSLLLPDSVFDRYQLPVIAFGILWLSYFLRGTAIHKGVFLFAILPFFYSSVAGTHDYMAVQEATVKAYTSLKIQQVEDGMISAGYEQSCWNAGDRVWLTDFQALEKRKYLIQFDAEPGFREVAAFPFYRYYPPGMDNVRIFVNDSLNKK